MSCTFNYLDNIGQDNAHIISSALFMLISVRSFQCYNAFHSDKIKIIWRFLNFDGRQSKFVSVHVWKESLWKKKSLNLLLNRKNIKSIFFFWVVKLLSTFIFSREVIISSISSLWRKQNSSRTSSSEKNRERKSLQIKVGLK